MIAGKFVNSSGEPRDFSGSSDEGAETIASSVLDSQRAIFVSAEPSLCEAEYCSSAAICVLSTERLCVHHFITRSFERLRCYSISWCVNSAGQMFESSDAFVRECILESAKLLQPTTEIDSVRRGHLLDVFLWASELAMKRRTDGGTA